MTKETQNSMAGMPEASAGGIRRRWRDTVAGASSVLTRKENSGWEEKGVMEAVVERENMMAAYKRVVGNKGAAGVDGMSVDELRPYLDDQWVRIKGELLEGRYEPQAVAQVEIPKPNGGKRKLGIPTVVDRLIQQAIHQVLEPVFDGDFSKSSYGFRRGRNAHQAVKQAREYVKEGRRWVVDID